MNKKIFFTLSLFSILFFLSGCGGGGGGGSLSTPPGTNPGIPSVIKLLDVQNIAQTNSTIFLKAKVLDGNGKPLPSVPVTFTNLSSPFGQLSATIANTDATGIATVTLNSGVPGFATIAVDLYSAAGQIRDRRSVYFTDNIKLTATMSLDVDSSPGNGIYNETTDYTLFENTSDDTVEILATVFDGRGVPVGPGISVSWQADHAEAVFVRTDTITNVNGQAKAIVQVKPESLRASETNLNVNAFASNGAANMVTLFLKPVVISSIDISANPSIIDSAGTSAITAYVTTTAGSPVPDGTIVNFTTSGGGVSDPFATTAGGIATTTYTAPTLGEGDSLSFTVRASVGGKSDTVTIGVEGPAVTPPTPPPPAVLAIGPVLANVNGIAPFDTVTFTITNGTAPYVVTSSCLVTETLNDSNGNGTPEAGESNFWDVTVAPYTFVVTVPAGAVPSTCTLTVTDFVGKTATSKLQIN